jgi:uncharacterized RDD family membrane protein YckC
MSTIAASPAASPPITAALHAGFWRRGAAAFVDGLVLLAANVACGFVAGPDHPFVALLLQIAIGVAYYALMHSSSWQATLGKRAFGIKVTTLDGARISIGRGVGRYFATWLSGLVFGIGFLLAAFTERKQALHDMVAGTVVVNAKASPEEIAAKAGGTMPLTIGVWLVIILLLIFPFFLGIFAATAIPAYQEYLDRAKARQSVMAPATLPTALARAENPGKSTGS